MSTATPYVSPKKGRRVRDKLEASPNSRAACRRCGKKITKGQGRVGIQGKIETAQGVEVWRLRYWHEECVSEGTKRSLHLAKTADEATASKKKAKRNNPNTKSGKTDKKKPKAKPASRSRGIGLKPKVRKQLEKDLRSLRRVFAETQSCEEYKIFQNRSLQEILTKLPTNEVELQQCWGIKEKRSQQYGDSILHVVNSYLRQFDQSQPSTTRQSVNNDPRSSTLANHQQLTPDEDDSDENIDAGPTLSIEEIVRQRVREAEARGEVLEIL